VQNIELMCPEIQEIFEANAGFLTSKDLTTRTRWYQLKDMIAQGNVIKVKRGLYRLEGHAAPEQLPEVVRIIPSGIFCMFTAWSHYELTTYLPFEYHVAIEKSMKVTLPAYPPVKLYYWTDNACRMGITEVEMDSVHVKMYDVEKSVCDAIRFRHKIGADIATEILKNYVKRSDRDLDKLTKYSRQLRMEKVMDHFLTVLL
jgi:predicted transcriptional regulator of viral defense system